MPGFWVRFLITACGLLLAAWQLDGIHIGGPISLLVAALVLGVVNAVVRPVMLVLTLPVTVVTLGVFLLVLNAAMLGLTAFVLALYTFGFVGLLKPWVAILIPLAFLALGHAEARRLGLVKVVQDLNRYGRQFDHPGWQPLDE